MAVMASTTKMRKFQTTFFGEESNKAAWFKNIYLVEDLMGFKIFTRKHGWKKNNSWHAKSGHILNLACASSGREGPRSTWVLNKTPLPKAFQSKPWTLTFTCRRHECFWNWQSLENLGFKVTPYKPWERCTMRRSFFHKGKEQGCLGGGSPFKDTTSTTTKEGSATHPGEGGCIQTVTVT